MIRNSRRFLLTSSLFILMQLVFVSAGNAQVNPSEYGFPQVNQSDDYIFRLVKVVEGLKHPWSLAFMPNGDMLITERPGRLRIVRNGVLDPEPIGGIPPVWFVGRAGLLDVVLHPDFESNQMVYFSYSKPHEDGEMGTMAAARGRFTGRRLVDVEDIFVAHPWAERPGHFGSRIAFDGNGHVFISTGDMSIVVPEEFPRDQNPAQDLSNHAGTIVRLYEDGSVPADNPFVNTPGAMPEIWSYGHRNIQGMTIDKENGELWAIEHGPTNGDEINHIRKGRNYGWPVIGYGIQSGGARIHKHRQMEGMEQPVEFWAPSIAPSGIMVYYGDKFPAWRGDIFVGSMRGHELHRLRRAMQPDGTYTIGLTEEPPMLQGIGRIRDVREGPDGYVYLVIDDHPTRGRPTPVLRMEPVEKIRFNPHYHPYLFGDEGGSAGLETPPQYEEEGGQ